jgi:hypothetical protein
MSKTRTRATAGFRGGRQRRRTGGSMTSMGGGLRCVPDFGAAEDFEFPDAPATPAQVAALESLIANFVREVMARQYKWLSPRVLGLAFGVEERRAQQIAATARNRGLSAMAGAVLELLNGMLDGKYPPVVSTPKTADTRWLFQQINYFDGDDWRELRHLSEADMDLFRAMHAAFRRDHLKWQGGR